MHDLEKEFDFCKKYMRDIGIQIADDDKISIAEDCYGNHQAFCRQEDFEEKIFSIHILKDFLNDKIPVPILRSIIMHELLHTSPRCLSHGKTFLKMAKYIYGSSHGKYNILVCTDDMLIKNPDKKIAAIYQCECGMTQYLSDETPYIHRFEDKAKKYKCGYCSQIQKKENMVFLKKPIAFKNIKTLEDINPPR